MGAPPPPCLQIAHEFSSNALSRPTAKADQNIKVLVRVRPANSKEKGSGAGAYRKALSVDGATNGILYEGAKTFTFDHCCDEETDQVRGACAMAVAVCQRDIFTAMPRSTFSTQWGSQ